MPNIISNIFFNIFLFIDQKCPKAVHELMLKCWEQERNQRPQFADIVVMMDEWIRSPETIRDSKLLYRNSGS